MAGVFTIIKTTPLLREFGILINLLKSVMKIGQMKAIIKGSIKKGKNMGWELINGLTELFMRVSGIIIQSIDM